MWMEGGTTIERFHTFIERILDNLDQRFPQRSFVFTMDNLAAQRILSSGPHTGQLMRL
jgi:hypothetical protein